MNILDLLLPETEAESRAGRIYGVVVGVVTNNQDPEGMGRVKVRFPWLNQTDESNWARVATMMTGKDRGTWFLPEVEDEVLVAFEHGDVQFPYVIGSLWNGKDTPPRDNGDGKNSERVIKSRSGHELIFGDEDGKEKVEIKTKAGHQVLLDDTSGSEKITVMDKSGKNKIELDSAGGSVAVTGDMKLSIKAQQIEITADTSITMKSQQIEISADAAATVKSSSMLTLKGALVKIN
ncbi:MAG TPA: phage baseplate assembly protein V [Pyrinomonadaceae bacterium]